MTLKRIIGMGAIAGALSFSAIGLAGAADAAPAPQTTAGVVQHAQLVRWGGGGRGPGGGGRGFGGRGFGDRGFGGRGFGGPGFGGRGFGGPIGWGAPPPCLIGLCI
jgi:hypothetical protein